MASESPAGENSREGRQPALALPHPLHPLQQHFANTGVTFKKCETNTRHSMQGFSLLGYWMPYFLFKWLNFTQISKTGLGSCSVGTEQEHIHEAHEMSLTERMVV